MPFAAKQRGGVLQLTLDTPRAKVNIFDQPTARQLVGLLAEVRPDAIRAIVLRTAKPTSFINGVGLLLSTAARNFDDSLSASAPIRAAYLAILRAPVPTIAVVEGMAWGCGVEFLLHTRHRLAVDSWDTQFRMTELADYHDMPLFGATEHLPAQVGLPRALELLLWGKRWNARQARDRGLVNELVETVDPERVDQAVDDFVARVLDGAVDDLTARRFRFDPQWEATLSEHRARIAELPPMYRKARSYALELCAAAARRGANPDAIQEVHRFGETTRDAKSAYGFFHIRQFASLQAAPSTATFGPEVVLSFRGDGRGLLEFRDELLGQQPLAGVRVTVGNAAPGWARFHAADATHENDGVAVALDFIPAAPGAGSILYRPGRGNSSRFIELRERVRRELGPLAAYLQRLGYEVAVSRGANELGTSILLTRFLSPLALALGQGERPEDVAATLHSFGVIRPLPELLAGMPTSALVAALSRTGSMGEGATATAISQLTQPMDPRTGRELPRLVPSLALSLLAAVVENLNGEGFFHAASIDLAAREMLDFPLHLGSLCGWLTPSYVAACLDAAPAGRGFADDVARAAAVRFVADGRPFYRRGLHAP